MDRMIQIRHVPAELHNELKARAAKVHTSLSEYLLSELHELAGRPTRQELLARLARLSPVDVEASPAELLRAERDGR